MNIVVYCGSNPGTKPSFSTIAHELGTWIARQGHNLVYGGSSVGLMGIVSQAVLNAGGKVHGIETSFFVEAGVAQHDLTELSVVDTMSERKARMIELGDVFIAIPGGVGTLEEISEIMSRIRLGLGPTECFFLNLDGFYDPLITLLEIMIEQNFIVQADLDRYHFAHTLEELTHMLDSHIESPVDSLVTASELAPQSSEPDIL